MNPPSDRPVLAARRSLALLDPLLNKDWAQISELRAAGVSDHRVRTLYPAELIQYVAPIKKATKDSTIQQAVIDELYGGEFEAQIWNNLPLWVREGELLLLPSHVLLETYMLALNRLAVHDEQRVLDSIQIPSTLRVISDRWARLVQASRTMEQISQRLAAVIENPKKFSRR